jgi:hypothetical protein
LCEHSLSELNELIVAQVAAAELAAETIVEARALRDAAADLYLDGYHDVALDLIDQAFALLGKRK